MYDSPKLRCEEAGRRIRAFVTRTPCLPSPVLSERIGARVFLKLENRQRSGSFKLRGVVNKILSLGPAERRLPLIAASTGNHAAAFAHALSRFGLSGKLFLPRTIAPVKRRWLEQTGLPLEFAGDDCLETELCARRAAEQSGAVLIPPYNDPDIIFGQGTIGVEVFATLRDLDAILVPVGGGGLISGIGAYLKEVSPRTKIIGCQPAASAVMCRSLQAGRIVEDMSLPTLSDATAGGIEPSAITFEFCRKYVDDFVLLDEQEIGAAIASLYRHHNIIVEGGGALSLAAARKISSRLAGQRVALVISGGRIEKSAVEAMARQNDGA